MDVRALAAKVALFDVLLGVVPGTTGIRHHQCHHHAADQRAAEHAAERLRPEAETDDDRRQDSERTRKDHPAQRGAGRDVDAACGVRLGLAFEKARDLFELAANLDDHVEGRVADSGHGHRADDEREDAADEHADENHRVVDRENEVRVTIADLGDIGADQGQCGECRGADGKALADGCGGVADLVERVGDLAGLGTHLGHFGNAAGIVGNRAVGVDCHGDADRGQHADSRHAHAVEAGEHVGEEDDRGDGQDRNRNRLHANGKAADHDGCRAGLAVLGDLTDRCATGVVLGDESDDDAADRADENRAPDTGGSAHAGDHEIGCRDEDHSGTDGAEAKRHIRALVGKHADRQDAEKRTDQAGGCKNQRHELKHGAVAAKHFDGSHRHRRGKGDRGDHRTAIGFEDVRSHAGNVADIVTDIVGDDGRVARVILGDAGLDLADQVGADVSRLGEDAATDAAEQGNRGAAHGEALDGLDAVRGATHEVVQDANAEQAHRRDGQAHDRAAEEGDVQRFGSALAVGGNGGTDIRLGGGVHADIAGRARAERAERKGKCRIGTEARIQGDNTDDAEYRETLVLAGHEDHRAEMDLVGDLLDPAFAGRGLQNSCIDKEGRDQACNAEADRKDGCGKHEDFLLTEVGCEPLRRRILPPNNTYVRLRKTRRL